MYIIYNCNNSIFFPDLKPTLQASSLSSKLGLPTSPDLRNNNTLHHQTYPSTFFSDLKLGLSSSPKSSQSSDTIHRAGHTAHHMLLKDDQHAAKMSMSTLSPTAKTQQSRAQTPLNNTYSNNNNHSATTPTG